MGIQIMRLRKKDLNLCDVIDDLMNKEVIAEARNPERVAKFVMAMAMNGLNRKKAAMTAGWDETSADNEAYKLMKNEEISAIVRDLHLQRVRCETLVEALDKSYIVELCYKIAMDNVKSSPKYAISAVQEISKLKGFYDTTINDNLCDIKKMHEEFMASGKILDGYFDKKNDCDVSLGKQE